MDGDLQRAMGRYLRRYRKKRGLSQEGFAEVLGVHRTYMGSMERGERNLTLQTVERIADAIAADVIEMLRDGELPADPDEAAGSGS